MTTATAKILIVDDDPTARLLMRAALRKAGYDVVQADGGADALRRFDSERFDLVMLDVDMPGMSGYEVCAALRARSDETLPIVMVTGMDDLQSVERAYQSGATDFIVKPINWALIGHRVKYLLRGHQTLLDLRAAQSRITRLAYFDSLTGLPNRQSFLERVDREIARADAEGTKLSVLFMDLDGFKNVNDTMGHSAGDLVLQWAADRLSQGLRPTDLVAQPVGSIEGTELSRLGGDEFTALILDIERPDDAVVVAHRIGQLMRRPFVVNGRDVTLTTSIGIAIYPDDGQDAATLLKHADTAMYHAKNSGRDHARLYTAALTEQAMHRMELDTSLRLALDRGEFHLVYQPQIDLATGRASSVEALIRWDHPTRGPIPPFDFIPLAEQNGLIERIGQWVLSTACNDAARWNREGQPVCVAVNLSPVQFRDPDLLKTVLATLAASGLAPELLELEVTEGALMENTAVTISTLHELRKHGVRIALDDFGTGYSSLSYLTRMPINRLKVDRCFINGLLDGGENDAIVRAVLAMAETMGMHVTAEGVETIEQAQALQTMACDSLQGYYFSRPVPADRIGTLLARNWALAFQEGNGPDATAAGRLPAESNT